MQKYSHSNVLQTLLSLENQIFNRSVTSYCSILLSSKSQYRNFENIKATFLLQSSKLSTILLSIRNLCFYNLMNNHVFKIQFDMLTKRLGVRKEYANNNRTFQL